jgi:hypothetical protein
MTYWRLNVSMILRLVHLNSPAKAAKNTKPVAGTQ